MSTSRREFLLHSVAGAAFGAAATRTIVTPEPHTARARATPAVALSPGLPGRDYRPVVTPNGATLPFKIVGETKVFHLMAQAVNHEFAPGLKARCWGYNGIVHGPTIEAVEGDRVRIYVTNHLEAPTSVHWHGLLLPSGMDGVGGLTQRVIMPGETFKYEFVLRQHGTYMYHAHHDEMTQMALGLMGIFVIHPRNPVSPLPDRDYAYMLSEWKIDPGSERPDPNEMTDFNVLTFNGKIAPATEHLCALTGERVRIRIGNLSAMDHHPIHLHGHSFQVVETDGGVIPEAGRWPEVTVLVPTGSTRTIEFLADNPGDWAVHCHMTHHVMTQMGHGIPNLTGVDPTLFDEQLERIVPEYAEMGMGGMGMTGAGAAKDYSRPRNSLPMVGLTGPFGFVTMSGMFTVLKVRDRSERGEEADWFEHPQGTVAALASAEDLIQDGISSGMPEHSNETKPEPH